jgi:hypothetical protein
MKIIIIESASSLRLYFIAMFYSMVLVWKIVEEEEEKKRIITATTQQKIPLWSDKRWYKVV